MVRKTREIPVLRECEAPQRSRIGITNPVPSRSDPTAADRKPQKVTPTCAAARNRLGFLVRRARRARRSVRRTFPPLASIWRSWDSRREIRAISAATKRPATMIKRRTKKRSRISWPVLPIGGLGSMVVRVSPRQHLSPKFLGATSFPFCPPPITFTHLQAPVGRRFTFILRIVGHVPARRRSHP